jgi:hypothetical protein
MSPELSLGAQPSRLHVSTLIRSGSAAPALSETKG